MPGTNGRNGATWLKAWRGAVATLMVAAVIAAWQASKSFEGLRVAVEGLQGSVEKIDGRVLYLERAANRRWP